MSQVAARDTDRRDKPRESQPPQGRQAVHEQAGRCPDETLDHLPVRPVLLIQAVLLFQPVRGLPGCCAVEGWTEPERGSMAKATTDSAIAAAR